MTVRTQLRVMRAKQITRIWGNRAQVALSYMRRNYYKGKGIRYADEEIRLKPGKGGVKKK